MKPTLRTASLLLVVAALSCASGCTVALTAWADQADTATLVKRRGQLLDARTEIDVAVGVIDVELATRPDHQPPDPGP